MISEGFSCFPCSYTISTLIPVESAGSFGDGRCCHPSGYLQIDGIRLCLSISRCLRPFRDCPGSSGTGYSVPSRALGVRRTVPPLRGCGMRRRLPRPFPRAWLPSVCRLAHHQIPFANSTRLIMEMVLSQIAQLSGVDRFERFTRMVSPEKVKSVTPLKGYKGLKSEAEWNS